MRARQRWSLVRPPPVAVPGLRPWPALAVAVLAVAGLVLLGTDGPGPLSRHMGIHLLLMNALAPALVLLMPRRGAGGTEASGWSLAAATLAQMAALWAAHLPVAMMTLAHLPAAQVPLHTVLFSLSLWFWHAVLSQRGVQRWRALVALLITGKLACLLGVLLVFAARPLYPDFAGLADQQQAGLWMIAACTLTYVAAAIALAAAWLRELGVRPRTSSRARAA